MLSFQSPWYLLLLVLVPALWVFSFRSLAGLGAVRRLVAIGLRSLIVVLLVLALADAQWQRTSERLTVIFLVDQSLSIPEDHRQQMRQYVNAAIRQLRPKSDRDRAGVIVFGREAEIEVPPHDEDVFMPQRVESRIDRQYTNLAAAMRLANASFPADSARRVVIVTDGNENLGDALTQAQELRDAGVSIDVVPIRYQAAEDVSVEKVALPSDVRKGQPFDLRVVLNNATDRRGQGRPIRGRLQVFRKAGDQETLRADQPITLPPGKHVFRVREQIDQPHFYTYEARFVPDVAGDDAIVQNNRASAFTHIRGSGQVLVVENADLRGQFDRFVNALREKNLEVTVQSSSDTFRGLADLQPYDTVVLANAPRDQFSDDQIKALVRNTQQMGAGLVMLGGQHSFGAGGWTNTELEAAMPVDFQIRNTKVAPVGALAMIMHASELADGNHWQKKIAAEAIKQLGGQDYCGVLHWDGNDAWLWRGGMTKVGPQRNQMLAAVNRMSPGDMPQFDPAMNMAAAAFARLPGAGVKHMIIISDGDPAPPTAGTINKLKNLNVTVSTMAVGTHGRAGSTPLQNIALQTGGKYYVVTDARALPRYYQREARRVSQSVVKLLDPPLVPQRVYTNEITKGIEGAFPPLSGFVMTTVKSSELVEVSLVSPDPPNQENATILANWTYGLGRTVAFTTDTGMRWAAQWPAWADYETFFSQMIRWSMRPTGETGKFVVATDVREGKVEVTVTALDQEDQFLNFLDITGKAVGPDMEPVDLRLRQVAPGRYRGEFDAKSSGSYFVVLGDGAGRVAARAGVDVPYSAEFRQRETNDALLANLARLEPSGGAAGHVIEDPSGRGSIEGLLETDVFRHDLPNAYSTQSIWPLMLLVASCLFFADVFVRRVHVRFDWLPPLLAAAWARVLRRDAPPVRAEYIERLRGRKAEVAESIDTRRASTRFEPSADAPPVQPTSTDAVAMPGESPQKPAPRDQSLAPEAETSQESYTSRLLKAKKKVWDEKKE